MYIWFIITHISYFITEFSIKLNELSLKLVCYIYLHRKYLKKKIIMHSLQKGKVKKNIV